jgi:hypothetical protein
MDELTALKERIYNTVELLTTDPERQRVETELRAVHRADDRVEGPYSDLIDLVRQDVRFDAWPESEKPESPVIKINNEYQYLFYFAETKDKTNYEKAVGVYQERRLRNLRNAITLSAKNKATRKAVSNSANGNSANSEMNSPFTYNSDNQLNDLSPKKGGRRTRTKKRKGDRTKRRLK